MATVVLWLAAPASFADLITLDTGVAPSWTVTRTLIGGETSPNVNGDSAGDSYTYPAVDVADPFYPYWVQASTVGDGLAQWVSWDPSTGIGYYGDSEIGANATSYVYTDIFTLNGAANASLEVNASLAADNIISGISLEDDTAAESVPLNITYNKR